MTEGQSGTPLNPLGVCSLSGKTLHISRLSLLDAGILLVYTTGYVPALTRTHLALSFSLLYRFQTDYAPEFQIGLPLLK